MLNGPGRNYACFVQVAVDAVLCVVSIAGACTSGTLTLADARYEYLSLQARGWTHTDPTPAFAR